MRVWFNGSVLAEPEVPVIRVDDHGLTVGDGVFEAIKVVDGQPFALTRHLKRIARSAAGLGLPQPDLDMIRGAVDAVLDSQSLPLGRLRITWTAGPAPLGSGRGGGPPSLVVVAAPMDAAAAATDAVRVPWVRNERSAVAGLKTTSYAENVVALAYARERGATEALFANTVGNLCEGTGSNVGYVINGEARTPTLASGCLAGVTRALAVEWCGIREIDEPVGILDEAEEIFLLSTTRDVQPVRRLDDLEFAVPGPVTRRLMDIWTEREAESTDPW
ncbi:MAG: 4-amino-4-deoxychorismate lyase [Marmoricola sp.]|nr:4-amino-4-deoxychorismate lyase [Marmoricola sp.]